ncbi:rhomboid family intramembrane serine protease [Nesterenkonia sp. NBAIMH1]|uniref:rhomboid family intramembrane serine protease n=1 Tax=Nesterenkonia sp. NBAIMH1 TaxID=2600320 RepID=UPI0011B3D7C6|nr:rhomboid family intramembrane serine protease [Nesterenkonia sp. NBAIMH1]
MDEARRSRPTQRTEFGAPLRPDEKPYLTYGVIGLCVVMYLLQWTGQTTGLNITGYLSYAPGHTSQWILEPWRMLTSAVLHSPANIMHIGFNMLALWIVGRVIEPAIGRLRYGALLLLSALGGSVAVQWLTEPHIPTVGASGAVFGLFGALFILMRSSGAETGGVIALVAVNMVLSFAVPNISWQGHLGGLVTGALVALVIARAPRRGRGLVQGAGLAAIAAGLVLLVLIGIPLVNPPQPGQSPILGV